MFFFVLNFTSNFIYLKMKDLDIRSLRQKIGLSQKELANKIGVHWRTVQNWEKNGGISQSDYTKICALIPQDELSPQQYYGGDTEKQKAGEPQMFIVPLMPISAKGGTLDEFSRSIMENDC